MLPHPDFGLAVEVRQGGGQQVPDERRFVVRSRVEGDERDAPHVQVRVVQRLEELSHRAAKQRVDRLRLQRDMCVCVCVCVCVVCVCACACLVCPSV